MNKFVKKLVLLGLIASIGATMVACGSDDKEVAKDEPAVVEEVEKEEVEETESEEGHTHEAPFEWSGKMSFNEGEEYTLKFNSNDEKEEVITIGFLRTDANIDDIEHHAAHMMDHEVEKEHFHIGEDFHAEHEYAYELALEGGTGEIKFNTHEGEYYVFLEHMPEEFNLEILDAEGNQVEISEEKVYEEGTEI